MELGDHGLEREADVRPQRPLRRHRAIIYQPTRVTLSAHTTHHAGKTGSTRQPSAEAMQSAAPAPRSAKFQSDRLLAGRFDFLKKLAQLMG